jgi:hypothetical protein
MNNFNKLTPAQTERLALLMEEMGEAQQAIGKILRFGYDACHPDTGIDNQEVLHEEVGHVLAAIDLMVQARDLSRYALTREAIVKFDTIKQYLHHN